MKNVLLLFIAFNYNSFSQSFLSPAYTSTPVQSSFDWNLAQKVLEKKEKDYNTNFARIESFLNSERTGVENSTLDKQLIANIQNRYFLEYVKPYYEKGYDLSSTVLTENIVNWLKEGFNIVLKSETEKFLKTKEISKIETNDKAIGKVEIYNKEIEAFKNKHGGYSVRLIEEFNYMNKQLVKVKSESNNGSIYYAGNTLFFKRGSGSWLTRQLIYQDYSPTGKNGQIDHLIPV